MDAVIITCPSCFQSFEIATPFPDEVPCDTDYDCEVCCRPLRILFEMMDGEVVASAYGLGDSGPSGQAG